MSSSNAALEANTGRTVHNPIFRRAMMNNFASPTDNIMSPCSAKLQAHKSKHFGRAAPKPLTLARLAAAENSSSNGA